MDTAQKDDYATEDYFSYDPENAPLGLPRHPTNTEYTLWNNAITSFPFENDLGGTERLELDGYDMNHFGMPYFELENLEKNKLRTEFFDTQMTSEYSPEYIEDPFLKSYTDDAYWKPPAESVQSSVSNHTAGPEAGKTSNTAPAARTYVQIVPRQTVLSPPQAEQPRSPSVAESSHKTQEELEDTESRETTGPSAKIMRNRKESQKRRDRKLAWEEKAKAALTQLKEDRLAKQETLTILRSETQNPAWNYSETWISHENDCQSGSKYLRNHKTVSDLVAEWNRFKIPKSKYSRGEIDEQLRISVNWKPGPHKRKQRNLYNAAKSRYNVEDRGVKLVNDLESCWQDCLRLDSEIQALSTEKVTMSSV
ncbi:hypothetical protein V866_005519 [Kwoniella sp. B9012]